jgi:hypothetical protein
VHIGDRESDIFELYCLAQELGTQFLVRSCVDRLAEDGDTTISRVLADIAPSGTHNCVFRGDAPTVSDLMRPPIPILSAHRFRGIRPPL